MGNALVEHKFQNSRHYLRGDGRATRHCLTELSGRRHSPRMPAATRLRCDYPSLWLLNLRRERFGSVGIAMQCNSCARKQHGGSDQQFNLCAGAFIPVSEVANNHPQFTIGGNTMRSRPNYRRRSHAKMRCGMRKPIYCSDKGCWPRNLSTVLSTACN